MTEYVSPFQQRGHDGPCHDMKLEPEQPTDRKAVKPIVMHVVPAGGDGTPLITGELEIPPLEPDAAGRYVVRVDVVKRALVTWLREAADELEQVLDTELDEQGLDDAGDIVTAGGAS